MVAGEEDLRRLARHQPQRCDAANGIAPAMNADTHCPKVSGVSGGRHRRQHAARIRKRAPPMARIAVNPQPTRVMLS
jgi:hypothetical protein